MRTYDYIFNSDKLAQMMKAGRSDSVRNWTQSDLVAHLSARFSGCGPDVQLSTIKRIEGVRSDDKTGIGILSAIKIAKALELPLPNAVLDERIEAFALELVRNPEVASERCDGLFGEVMRNGSNWRKKASWNQLLKGTPTGTLDLLPAFFSSFGPVRLSIRSRSQLNAFMTPELIDESGLLPFDLVTIFEQLGGNINTKLRKKRPTADKLSPSGFWRHLPSGKSENIGIDRLAEEISRYEYCINQCDESDYVFQIDLRRLIIVAFLNLLNLVIKVKECEGYAMPDGFVGYVNGYAMLLRLSDAPYQRS